jgi:signal transduction histidine kinase/HAMP domain-containing protein
MKLRTQFLLGSGILIVVLFTMAVLVVSTRTQLAALGSQHEFAASVQQQANDLAYSSSDYLLYGDQVLRDRWDSLFVSFLRNLDRLQPETVEDAALVNSMKLNARRLHQVFTEVAATATDTSGGNLAESPSFLQVALSRMDVQNRQIVFDGSRLERSLEEQADHAMLVSNIAIFAMMGLFGLLLLVGYFTMYRQVIAGIAAIRIGTAAVGRGDLDHRIPALRRDELGDLSRSFNAMTADLKQVTASKTELENEVAERRQAEAERERLMEELSCQNAELARREEELEAQNEALRQAEEALQEGAKRLLIAQGAMGFGIQDYDMATGTVRWDARTRELWGVAGDEPITTETFLAGVHPDDREVLTAAVEAAMGSEGPHEAYYRVIDRAEGRERWLQANWQVSLEGGRAVRMVGTVVDVSDRRIAEAAEAAARARLAAEAERSRVARDLHDSVTQALFAASLKAEALTMEGAVSGKARDIVGELSRLTRGALAQMRTMLLDLRGEAVEEVPIQQLLRTAVQATEASSSVNVSLTIEGDVKLPAGVHVATYRITQEALNNVAKHARASNAWVSLHMEPSLVRLVVGDDGCGFEPGSVDPSHMGLASMEERAREAGAELSIHTAPGEGTIVRLTRRLPAPLA